MSKRILVLGATGMLGASLFRGLSGSEKWKVTGTVRKRSTAWQVIDSVPDAKIIDGVDAFDFESIDRAIRATGPSVVINCIGVVKQLEEHFQSEVSIEINSLFPRKLARACSDVGARLIHFSTDCVFSGQKRNYVETDVMDASDLYGRSKALGEIDSPPHLTLRTSIIGHETNTAHSLIDWYLSQTNVVKGYRGAIFSGIPTVVISQLLNDFILDSTLSGIFHLSAKPISKFDLLSLVKRVYEKGPPIMPCDEYKVDKSLNSDKLKAELGLQVDDWPSLVNSMHDEYRRYFAVQLL